MRMRVSRERSYRLRIAIRIFMTFMGWDNWLPRQWPNVWPRIVFEQPKSKLSIEGINADRQHDDAEDVTIRSDPPVTYYLDAELGIWRPAPFKYPRPNRTRFRGRYEGILR